MNHNIPGKVMISLRHQGVKEVKENEKTLKGNKKGFTKTEGKL